MSDDLHEIKQKRGVPDDHFEVEIRYDENGLIDFLGFVEDRESSIESSKDAALAEGLERDLYVLSYSWFRACMGFFEAFPILNSLAGIATSVEVDRIAKEYIVQKKVSEEINENTSYFRLHERERHLIQGKISNANRVRDGLSLISKSLFLSLVSEYENHIRRVFRSVSQSDPRKLIDSGQKIHVDRLFQASETKILIEELVSDKVDSYLRESHVRQLEELGKLMGIDLLKDKDLARDFAEICARRNIVAHNGSLANSQYRNASKFDGNWSRVAVDLDHKVNIDESYLRRSIARLFIFGFFPLQLYLQKTSPIGRIRSIDLCISVAHDFLSIGMTKTARKVCDFGLTSWRRGDSEVKNIYLIVNKALTYFLDDSLDARERNAKVEDTLSERDWSLIDPKTRLALACLREDYSSIDNLVDAAVTDGLDYWSFSNWTVFTKARKNDEFCKAVSSHLGLEFSKI